MQAKSLHTKDRAGVSLFVVRPNDKRSSISNHLPKSHFCIFLQNATAGTRITIINATDKDAGRNAEIKFKIISGNDDGKFLLNETSGELFTAGVFDYDKAPNSYKVKRALSKRSLTLRQFKVV